MINTIYLFSNIVTEKNIFKYEKPIRYFDH